MKQLKKIWILLLLFACGNPEGEVVRGKISAKTPIITPIYQKEGIIVGITLQLHKAGKGMESSSQTYCFLAKGATLDIKGKKYVLALEKDFALDKPIPFQAERENNKGYEITSQKPEDLPQRLRNFQPNIEDYIRLLRKDAPTKLSVPMLDAIYLKEWYYKADKTIKIRVKLQNDTAYFRPEWLF